MLLNKHPKVSGILIKNKVGVVHKIFCDGHLVDNCIVFENFMASVGDLMVAN